MSLYCLFNLTRNTPSSSQNRKNQCPSPLKISIFLFSLFRSLLLIIKYETLKIKTKKMSVVTTQSTQQQQERPLTTEQEILQEFNRKRQGQQQIMQQIASIEGQIHEHNLVYDQIKTLNADRRAHRLVGGALIEKTVGEIRPEIEDSLKKFNAHIQGLQDNLLKKEKEIEEFMTTYKISITSGNNNNKQQQTQKQADGEEEQSKGVLA